jgi:hypothetical protein
MYFSRFDVAEAYYRFMSEYHGGQGSKEYAMSGTFRRLGFDPKGAWVEHMSENAMAIYDELVRTKGKHIRDRRMHRGS